jgi:ribulose-5-phosphate 4-epimerase/fuculose-1-phosphate aldolase
VIPEIPYYIGPVAWVPYLAPGSHQLASAVTSAMKKHDLAILRNHGLVAVGKTFDEVITKAVFFELACKIILHAGQQLQVLSKEAITELRQKGQANRTKPGI